MTCGNKLLSLLPTLILAWALPAGYVEAFSETPKALLGSLLRHTAVHKRMTFNPSNMDRTEYRNFLD
jgi:hypothetical protein